MSPATRKVAWLVAGFSVVALVWLLLPRKDEPFVLDGKLDLPKGYRAGALAFVPGEERLILVPHHSLDQTLVFNPGKLPVARAIPTKEPIWSALAVSPDGARIAVPSAGPFLKIFDLETGQIQATFPTEDILTDRGSVAWSPDGRHVAFADSKKQVLIGEASSGKVVETLMTGGWCVSLAFHPEGSMLASGGHDGVVNVWTTSTWRLLHSFRLVERGPEEQVFSVTFSRDGGRLAAGGGFGWSNSERSVSHGTVKVWTVKEWAVERVLDLPLIADSVTFSPEGRHLAFSLWRSVRVWDLIENREIWFTNLDSAGQNPIVRFSPGGTLAAVEAEGPNSLGSIQLWRWARPPGP